MAIEIKKLRVMWEEYVNIGSEEVNFLISFDNGTNWISLANVLDSIRTSEATRRNIPLSTYTLIDQDFSAVDFTIPLTFNHIPSITGASVIPVLEGSNDGLPEATEYRIKVAEITSDFVGLTNTESRIMSMGTLSKAKVINNLAVRGNIELELDYSDAAKGLAIYLGKKIIMTLKGTVATTGTKTVQFNTYTLDGYTGDVSTLPTEYGTIFGRNYITSLANTTSGSSDSAINGDGIIVYRDDSQMSIKKITQNGSLEISTNESPIKSTDINTLYFNQDKNAIIMTLKNDLVDHTSEGYQDTYTLQEGDKVEVKLNVYHYRLMCITNLVTTLTEDMSESQGFVKVSAAYPLPYKGAITIDAEKIEYQGLEFDNSTTPPSYILGGDGGSIIRNGPTQNHKAGSIVYLSLLDGGAYGALPQKTISVFQNSDNLITYYNFESISSASQSILNMVGSTSANNGIKLGLVESAPTDSFLKNAASFNKKGIVLTKLNMGEQGTIHFYFKLNSMPTSDMYLFGNTKGLQIKLCKDTLRLQVEYEDKVIIKSTDPRLSKVKVNELTEVGITWNKSEDFSSANINLFKGGALEADTGEAEGEEVFNFNPADSEMYYAIGGLINIEDMSEINTDFSNLEYTDGFEGYIDDWRVYDVALDQDEMAVLDSNLREHGFEYSGKILIDSKFVKNNVFTDYAVEDSRMLKLDPYILTYFSILEADNDDIEEANDREVYCDLWPLYSLENGNLFEPSLLATDDYDTDYGKIIKKADGKYVARVNYPQTIKNIKYRFELSGDINGFSSPIVKNFATIVSTSNIDFE